MSVQEMEKLDDTSMRAWDQHDLDAWALLFADKFELRDDTQQQPSRTKEEAKQFMQAWVTAFPDMRVRSLTRVVSDDAVGAELEFSGTNTGPLNMGGQSIPATNKSVVGHAAYFAKAKNGKIIEYHCHPNVLELMGQLGLTNR
jgi:predicted ester cyclase